jgi:hypothetical protein
MTESETREEILHDQAAELLEGYALGALEPAEAAMVDEHLEEGCEDCEQEVSGLVHMLQALPLASRLVAPPSDDLKVRVLDAIQLDATETNTSSATMTRRDERVPIPISSRVWMTQRVQGVAAAFGIIAIGGLLAWAIVLQGQVNDLEGENSALASAMQVRPAAVSDGGATNVSVANALFTLTGEQSSSLQFISSQSVDARARLMWDPDEALFVLAATGLDPTPGSGAYIVWVETPDGPVQLARLYVDQSGASIVDGTTDLALAQVDVMTITHEDDPTTSTPTGATLLTFSR